ncbi:hypothetical protein Btru_047957 [Bulinus truncatus]|nr:hypothetical protein Btru_047957 [Bulinus truncatus]
MDSQTVQSRYLPKFFAFLIAASLCYSVIEFSAFQHIPLNRLSNSTGKTISHFRFSFLRGTIEEDVDLADSDSLSCKVIDIDPYSPNAMKLCGLEKKPVQCSGYLPEITYIKGNNLKINKSVVTRMKFFASCKYRDIFRHPDSDHRVAFGNWSALFTSGVQLPDDTEFIVAVCENKESKIISKTYHALVPRHENIMELDMLKQKKRQVESRPEETLNVIMVGMDGTSRHQMMRGMNQTYTFLMDELKSFDMTMYNQIGKNTFPNYVPLFSGYTEDEIERWWHRSKHLDPLDTVWRDYTNAGYRTLYTEDFPSIGGFHFSKQGFLFPPTTYYSHPICVAMEKDKDLWRSGSHCAGNTPEVDFHFDYILRFLDSFPDSPVFSTSFFTKLTHGDMSNNHRVDLNTYRFYKTLRERGHLNKSLLITYSDHGPRWGPIRATLNGMIESRAPYAVFSFPGWFIEKYPDVARNLKINTRRLTTHYDTHATLRDLLYFKSSGEIPFVPRRHGISLLREIPKNRTCTDIPIPMEFCLCDQQTMEEMSVNSNVSVGLAETVVREVNSKRNKTMCAELSLKAILSVTIIKLPILVSSDKRLFKVKVQATPGGAIYEGTVRATIRSDEDLLGHLDLMRTGNRKNQSDVTVGDSIDRLNLYRKQAHCEPDSTLKPYCFCKK